MTGCPATIFKLSEGKHGFGLSCDARGLTLAGVPLLHRVGNGFVSRSAEEIQWLIDRAYLTKVPVAPLMKGLNVVAQALSESELVRAMIAAVLLKLPELDWHGAVRIAQADDGLAKYDPNELRDLHGRWTSLRTTTADPVESGRNTHRMSTIARQRPPSDGTIIPISDQGKSRSYDQCIQDCADLTLGASKLPPGSSGNREWEFRRCVNTCLGIGEPWPHWVPLFPPQSLTPVPQPAPNSGPSPWWVIPLLPFPGNPLYGGV